MKDVDDGLDALGEKGVLVDNHIKAFRRQGNGLETEESGHRRRGDACLRLSGKNGQSDIQMGVSLVIISRECFRWSVV